MLFIDVKTLQHTKEMCVYVWRCHQFMISSLLHLHHIISNTCIQTCILRTLSSMYKATSTANTVVVKVRENTNK